MLMSAAHQGYIFLTIVFAGIIIGFIYDLFRMVRIVIMPGRFLTAVLDLLFWIVVSALAFVVLFYSSDGEIRFYTLAGFALGWLVYFFTFSRWVMGLFRVIYRGIVKISKFAVKIVTGMLKMIKRLIGYNFNYRNER